VKQKPAPRARRPAVAENQRSNKKAYIDLATQVFFNSPNTAVKVFLMNPIHFIIFSQFEYFLN